MSSERSNELLTAETRKLDELLLLKKSSPHESQQKKTFRPPPSSVLSQVKDFLPHLAAANKHLDQLLETNPANSVDIENVEECQGDIIEMDLALVEQDSSCTSDADTDSDEDVNLGEVTEENIRLGPRVKHCQKPVIECITEDSTLTDLTVQSACDPEMDTTAVPVTEKTAEKG